MTTETIDRLSPTLEPDLPLVMLQDWRHLLFLHWEIPPAELQALLPAGLELDTFDGKAYVGLVPFTVSGARPVLAPAVPGISNFHEINVRTYVHDRGRHPGVWFFSLDASGLVAVEAARLTTHLPYFLSAIEFTVIEGGLPSLRWRSTREDPRGPMPANATIDYNPMEGPVAPAPPGTLEHFLIERYILYASHDHHLFRGRVHHEPYRVQRAEVPTLDETLVWASGIRRSGNRPITHYSPGVDVKIYAFEQVR
jgi:uncharacterized protein